MTPLIKELFSAVQSVPPTAANGEDPFDGGLWFDLGTLPDSIAVDVPNLRNQPLPFDRCFIAGRDCTYTKFLILVAVASKPGESPAFLLAAFALTPTKPQRTPLFAAIIGSDGWRVGDVPDQPKIPREEATQVVAVLSHFLERLSNTNNPTDPNEPLIAYLPTLKQNSLTNRRLLLKHKRPTQYTWTTVVIPQQPQQPPTKQPPKGGTHASPREHDRRGHWRLLTTGHRVWVRPCKVGNPELGRSDHDYLVQLLDRA